MKTPPWIDPNWADGLSELEHNFATGTFKDIYWRKLVGFRVLDRGIETDEERLTKNYYSKNQSIKPVRHIEWRPIYVNLLETQFVNKAQGAWRIFQNPHTLNFIDYTLTFKVIATTKKFHIYRNS